MGTHKSTQRTPQWATTKELIQMDNFLFQPPSLLVVPSVCVEVSFHSLRVRFVHSHTFYKTMYRVSFAKLPRDTIVKQCKCSTLSCTKHTHAVTERESFSCCSIVNTPQKDYWVYMASEINLFCKAGKGPKFLKTNESQPEIHWRRMNRFGLLRSLCPVDFPLQS